MPAVITDEKLVQELLAERQKTGAARWDEVWDGVVHMSPMPSIEHQREEKRLLLALHELVEKQGLGEVFHQVNVADPVKGMEDYRVPDICVLLPSSQAKVERTYIAGGPDLVIEIHSPEDETYEKLPWYAKQGVREVVVINRDTRKVELFRNKEGQMVLEASSPQAAELETVPLVLRTVKTDQGLRVAVHHKDDPQRIFLV
jgi:Uma2 family endonuclease